MRIDWHRLANAPEAAANGADFGSDSSGRLYVFLRSRGLFQSSDNMDRWSRIVSVEDVELTCFDVFPAGNLVIGARDGLYLKKGTEGPQKVKVGTADSAYVHDVSIKHTDSLDLVYALVDDGTAVSRLYVSLDSGLTWNSRGGGSLPLYQLQHASNGIRYASGRNFVLKNADEGGWNDHPRIDHDLTVHRVLDIAASLQSEVVYAVMIVGSSPYNDPVLYRLNDWGRWIKVDIPNSGPVYDVLANGASDVYAACAAGVFHSVDNGGSWRLWMSSLDYYPITKDPHLYMFRDDLCIGSVGELVCIDVESHKVKHVARGSGAGDISDFIQLGNDEYIVTSGDRIYRSGTVDSGWVEIVPEVNAGLGSDLGDYHVLRNQDGLITLFGRYGDSGRTRMLQSLDGGISWVPADSQFVDPVSDGYSLSDGSLIVETLLRSPNHFNPFRSTDGGRTWNRVFWISPRFSWPGEFAAAHGEVVLHMYNSGLLRRSTNNGEIWEEIAELRNAESNAWYHAFRQFDMTQDGMIYGRRHDTVFVSSDSGLAWERIRIPVSDSSMRLFSPYHTGILILANETGGWWGSTDHGLSWSSVENSGMPIGHRLLNIFSASRDTLYAIVANPLAKAVSSVYRAILQPVSGVPTDPWNAHPQIDDIRYLGNGKFEIKAAFPAPIDFEVSLISMRGVLAHSSRIRLFNEVVVLDVGDQYPGVYLISMKSEEGRTYRKVLLY